MGCTRVKAARMAAGIARRELARRIGVSYQYLADVEDGRNRPGMKTAIKLARELDLTVDYIALDPAYSNERRA